MTVEHKVQYSKLQAGDVSALLCKRYEPPAWAYLPQLRNGTGFARGQDRTADAVAMSLWPSRGLEVHGFEIKCRRDDLVKELKNPRKADDMMKWCDRWWLVLGDQGLIEPGELPPTWGLLVVRKGKLHAVTEAPKLKAKPLDRLFVAAVLRNALNNYVPADVHDALKRDVDAKAEERMTELVEFKLRDLERAKTYAEESRDAALKAITDFEKCAGIHIAGWNAGDIGHAVRVIVNRADGGLIRNLATLREHAEKITNDLQRTIATINADLAVLQDFKRPDPPNGHDKDAAQEQSL